MVGRGKRSFFGYRSLIFIMKKRYFWIICAILIFGLFLFSYQTQKGIFFEKIFLSDTAIKNFIFWWQKISENSIEDNEKTAIKPTDCQVLENAEKRIHCLDTISEKIAVETLEKPLCKRISDIYIQKRCEEGIDAKILAKITKKEYVLTSDCAFLDGNFKTECLRRVENYPLEDAYQKAIQSQNPNECSLLLDEQLSRDCRDEIFLQLAKKTHINTHCTAIVSPIKKQECAAILKNTHQKTLFDQAVSENNLTLCASLADANMRDGCHDIVVLSLVKSSSNFALCSGIKNETSRWACLELIPN